MSTELILTDEDIFGLTDCWSSLQTNNRYHKGSFISRLFSNLIAANPKLKKIFKGDDVMAQQASLFGDVLSFTMVYLDDPETLNQCMGAFMKENPSFVDKALEYLEPMGSALILTFRQWLGKGRFDADLQNSWVKVYVYIANTILTYAAADETRSMEEEPIQALRPRARPAPQSPVESEAEVAREVEQPAEITPAPVAATKPNVQSNSSTIKFELASNEKYRGFRRSVQEAQKQEPISIKIPSTPTFQQVTPPLSPPSAPFDPRKMRSMSRSSSSLNSEDAASESSSFDPRRLNKKSSSIDLNDEIPERSARRLSTILQPVEVEEEEKEVESSPRQNFAADPRKMSFNKPSTIITDTSDDEFEEKERGFGFDPRKISRKKSLSPIISDGESEVEPNSPLFSAAPVEEDDYNFEMKATPETAPSKPAVFDHNSFGIRGLAPIVESDYDDTTSSKYESDDEGANFAASSTDGDEASSGASTLSLHNSDYRSSINSGSDATSVSVSPDMNKFQMSHNARQPSTVSDISYMKPLAGSNEVMKAPRHQASTTSLLSSRTQSQQYRNRASLGFLRSSFVLKKEMEEQGFNEPENVLLKPPTMPAAKAASGASSKTGSTTSLLSSVDSNADGCLDLLNSFVPVTNLSAKAQKPASVKPQPRHYQSTSDLQSTSSKRTLRSRISRIFSSSSSRKSKSSDLDDLASLCSVSTSRSIVSGFSFFSKKRTLIDTRYSNCPTHRSKDKYNVREVPFSIWKP